MLIYERNADLNNMIAIMEYDLNLPKGEVHVVPHIHRCAELSFVAEGEYFVHVGTEQRVLKPGDIVFIKPNQAHYYKSLGKAKVFACIFPFDTMYGFGVNGKIFDTFIKSQYFDFITDLLHISRLQMYRYSDERKRGIIYAILGLLATDNELKNYVSDKDDSLISNIMQYIEDNYMKDIKLADMCDKFGYSLSWFSKLFNNFMGMSFRDYVNQYRIQVAESLLKKNEKMSLNKIADIVGFESWNTFYRAWKKYSTVKKGSDRQLSETENR